MMLLGDGGHGITTWSLENLRFDKLSANVTLYKTVSYPFILSLSKY